MPCGNFISANFNTIFQNFPKIFSLRIFTPKARTFCIHIEPKWRIPFWNNSVLGSIMVFHYMPQTQEICVKFAYHRNHNEIHHVVWNSFTQFKISEMYCTLLDALYLEASLHHSLFSKCLAVPLLTAKDVWVFCDLYLRFIPSINLWKKSIFKIFDSAVFVAMRSKHIQVEQINTAYFRKFFVETEGATKIQRTKPLFSLLSSKDWWKVWIGGT